MSLNSIQLTRLHTFEITPIILINLNLLLAKYYKLDNILISIIIPSPKKYKDLNSFLFLLIEDLKQLGKEIYTFNSNI